MANGYQVFEMKKNEQRKKIETEKNSLSFSGDYFVVANNNNNNNYYYKAKFNLHVLLNSNRELDSKMASSQSTLTSAEAKIKELESLLAKSRTGGGDAVLSSELSMVAKERDDLKERLKEFEIIADDLANLKRLQQENEQLKRSLAGKGQNEKSPDQDIDLDEPVGGVTKNDDQPVENDPFENLAQSGTATEDNSAFDEFLSASAEVQSEEPVQLPTENEPVKAAEPAVAPSPEVKGKSDKTPEDLLSEFEKMLG
jgi:hypothetical protein